MRVAEQRFEDERVGRQGTVHEPAGPERVPAPAARYSADTMTDFVGQPVQLKARWNQTFVQFRRSVAEAYARMDAEDGVHAAAAQGVAGGGGEVPHMAAIQASFGRHDVSGVRAHVGGAATAACDDMGALAYASGGDVAFRSAPDLHTAAHEAAHVVQQRGGVQLKGGVGQVGDAYERHADAVADLVVQGKSAEGLLDAYAGGGGGTVAQRAVQRTGGPPVGGKTGVKTTPDGSVEKFTKVELKMPTLYAGILPPAPPQPGGGGGIYASLGGGVSIEEAAGLEGDDADPYVKLAVGGSVSAKIAGGLKTVGEVGIEAFGGATLGPSVTAKFSPRTKELEIAGEYKGTVSVGVLLGWVEIKKDLKKYELLKIGGSLGAVGDLTLASAEFRLGKDVGELARDILLVSAALGNPLTLTAALAAAGWQYVEEEIQELVESMTAAMETTLEVTEAVGETAVMAMEGIALLAIRPVAYDYGFYSECAKNVVGYFTMPSAAADQAAASLNKAAVRKIQSVVYGEMQQGSPAAVTKLDVPLNELVGGELVLSLMEALMAVSPEAPDIGQWTYAELIMNANDAKWLSLRLDPHGAGVAVEAAVDEALAGGAGDPASAPAEASKEPAASPGAGGARQAEELPEGRRRHREPGTQSGGYMPE